MSENKHTEGPWWAEGPDDFGDYTIAPTYEPLAIGAAISNMRPAEEVAANAQLWAAAPETKAQRDALFNAALGAEQVIADFIGVYGDSGAGEVLAELRAAIRRAQGGGDE